MKKLLIVLILLCVVSSNAFGTRWSSRYSNPSYRNYSPSYSGSNWYLKSMIYGNTNKINQNLNKINNNEIKISRNSIKTIQNEASTIQNSTKGLNNQSAIIQNAADIESLQSDSDSGSSSESDPFKYVTRDGNGNIIGMSKITVDYNQYYTEVILRFSDDFQEEVLDKTGKMTGINRTIYYQFEGCQGKLYRVISLNGDFIFKKFKGILLSQADILYYTPSNTPMLLGVDIKSYRSTGTMNGVPFNNCEIFNKNNQSYNYIEVFPNDPSITGIYEYPFPLPITFDGMETQ